MWAVQTGLFQAECVCVPVQLSCVPGDRISTARVRDVVNGGICHTCVRVSSAALRVRVAAMTRATLPPHICVPYRRVQLTGREVGLAPPRM